MDLLDETPASPPPSGETAPAEESTSAAPAELAPILEGINCPDCGYDLRGLTGARCPECGFDLEIVRTQTPQIPWARRREIGRFRAYWQTVWLVFRHPRRLHIEMVRPVSYRDSQSFRWVTFLHAFVPVVLSAGVTLATRRQWSDWDSVLLSLALVLGVGVMLVALPGAGSYALESRRLPVEQRNRGIALSYYSWAPLASFLLTLFFVLVACITNLVWDSYRNDAAFAVVAICFMAAVLLPLASLLVAEARLGLLAKRVLHGHGRVWPRLIWVNAATAGALLLAAIVPLSVFYFIIIWYSFH
jgi:hypothetical protein